MEGDEVRDTLDSHPGLKHAVSVSDISQQQLQAEKEELLKNLDMDPYDEDQVGEALKSMCSLSSNWFEQLPDSTVGSTDTRLLLHHQ